MSQKSATVMKFGWIARIRQLADNTYVAEQRYGFWPFFVWFGIDQMNVRHRWHRSHKYFKDCVCSSPEEAARAIARAGIGKNDGMPGFFMPAAALFSLVALLMGTPLTVSYMEYRMTKMAIERGYSQRLDMYTQKYVWVKE